MATLLRSELATEIRRLLGELTAGQHSAAEIDAAIQTAVDQTCSDSVSTDGFALLEKTYGFHTVAGQRAYEMPKEVVEVLKVDWQDGGEYKPLAQVSQDSIEAFRDPAESDDSPSSFAVTDARKLMSRGIATGGSALTCVDADRTDFSTAESFVDGTNVVNENGSAMRDLTTAGNSDALLNITDDSESAIDASGIAVTTLTMAAQTAGSGLSGGDRNNFELGDEYEVRGREYTRKNVVLRNAPTSTDQTAVVEFTAASDSSYGIGNVADVNQKVAMSFKLTRDTVISGVSIKLAGTTGTPLGAMVVRVETNSSTVPSGTLVDFRAKATNESPDASDWNEIYFKEPFRAAANTQYWITAEVPTQSGYYGTTDDINNYFTWAYDDDGGYDNGSAATHNGTSWTASAATVDMLFKVHSSNQSENMRVRAAVTIPELVDDSNILPFPTAAITAIRHKAVAICLGKRQKSQDQAEAYERRYEVQMGRVQDKLRQEQQSGYGVIGDLTPWPSGVNINRTWGPGNPALYYDENQKYGNQ